MSPKFINALEDFAKSPGLKHAKLVALGYCLKDELDATSIPELPPNLVLKPRTNLLEKNSLGQYLLSLDIPQDTLVKCLTNAPQMTNHRTILSKQRQDALSKAMTRITSLGDLLERAQNRLDSADIKNTHVDVHYNEEHPGSSEIVVSSPHRVSGYIKLYAALVQEMKEIERLHHQLEAEHKAGVHPHGHTTRHCQVVGATNHVEQKAAEAEKAMKQEKGTPSQQKKRQRRRSKHRTRSNSLG